MLLCPGKVKKLFLVIHCSSNCFPLSVQQMLFFLTKNRHNYFSEQFQNWKSQKTWVQDVQEREKALVLLLFFRQMYFFFHKNILIYSSLQFLIGIHRLTSSIFLTINMGHFLIHLSVHHSSHRWFLSTLVLMHGGLNSFDQKSLDQNSDS